MRSPAGASAAILRLARQGRLTLLVSVALALEYEAVCRAEHRLAAGLSEGEVNVFADAMVALAEPVTMHFLWRPQLRDPCDEMVLEAAINGEADALVTFNTKDFGEVPRHFGMETSSARSDNEDETMSETKTYPLRLPKSLKDAVERISKKKEPASTSSSRWRWRKRFRRSKRRASSRIAKLGPISKRSTGS